MALSDDIQKLYIAYFNRPADPGGLSFWIGQANSNGGSTAAVATAFSTSPEYQAAYAGLSSTAIVNKVYQNLFGRAAEADGLQYWTTRLANGTFNVGNIVTAIFTGAQNADAVAVANKTQAAAQFTASLTTPGQIAAYTTARAVALASDWLNGAATATGLATTLSGLGLVIVAIVGGTPSSDGGSSPSPSPSAPPAITVAAFGTYTGTVGNNDVFKSTIADLNGAQISGDAADTDVLTLTTAGAVTINNGSTGGIISNIKVLNLADGTNTLTYSSSAGFVSIKGGAGDDTFIISASQFPLVLDGGAGTDTIVLTAIYAITASGSSTFATNVTGFEKLRLTGVSNGTVDLQVLGNYSDVTLNGTWNGFTLLNLPSNGKVSLTSAGTSLSITNTAFTAGVNDIVNLSLSDGSGAAVAFASSGITAAGVETATISVNDSRVTPTGTFNNTLTWLGNSVKTINVSGNAGLTLSAASTALTTVDASGISLGGFTWTAAALAGLATVKGSASGTNTVNLSAATAGVAYTGGTGNDNVTINGAVSSTAALGEGTNSLALNGATILGTYTAGSGTDSLAFFSSTPDISAATVTGFENLTLANNASITMTAAQLAQFTGTINAAAVETLTLATAGTVTALANIENYNLANGTNNFTAANTTLTVVGGTGNDTINVTANQIANVLTSVNGGGGTNTLSIGSTATQNIDLSAKVTNVATINVAGSTGTASLTNANGAGIVLNYTKGAGDNTIILGSGGQTLNVLGSSAASTTITGGAAVDTINLPSSGSGSETLIETGANMSNKTQIDVVGNFNATGIDYFKTGVNATSVDIRIIGNADTANYLTTLAGDLSAVLTNTGQAFLVTIQTGTAAGTYLFQNTGSDINQFDNTDLFVQLTGTVGTVTTANLIA